MPGLQNDDSEGSCSCWGYRRDGVSQDLRVSTETQTGNFMFASLWLGGRLLLELIFLFAFVAVKSSIMQFRILKNTFFL